jgi:hypothetical protein
MIESLLEKKESILSKIINVDLDKTIVILGGSKLEGFGNQKSDIDIFVLCTEPLDFKKDFEDKGYGLIDGTIVKHIETEDVRYDYVYIPFERIQSITNHVNHYDNHTDPKIYGVNVDEMDFIHRTKFTLPICGEEAFNAWKETVDYKKFNIFMTNFYLSDYEDMFEDVQGAMLSKDLWTAFIRARMMVEKILSAFLSIHDETNPGDKWLYRKLKRFSEKIDDNTLLKEFLDLITTSVPEEKLENHLNNMVNYAEIVHSKTQIALNKIR